MIKSNRIIVALKIVVALTALSILQGHIALSRAPGVHNIKSIAGPVTDPTAGLNRMQPELPRIYLDTTYLTAKGNIITVSRADMFQEALNRAKCGDVVSLAAGITFQGNFVLPNKGECNDWIIIRSDTPDSSLSRPGTRVTPAYAKVMAKVFSPNVSSAITTAPGANHYRFVGVEIGVTNNLKLSYGIF